MDISHKQVLAVIIVVVSFLIFLTTIGPTTDRAQRAVDTQQQRQTETYQENFDKLFPNEQRGISPFYIVY